MWFGALFQYREFKEMVKERWKVLKGPFSTVTAFIEETREKNRASWEYNVTVWPTISNSVNGDISLSYDAAVDRLKQTFLDRLRYIDAIINSW